MEAVVKHTASISRKISKALDYPLIFNDLVPVVEFPHEAIGTILVTAHTNLYHLVDMNPLILLVHNHVIYNCITGLPSKNNY